MPSLLRGEIYIVEFRAVAGSEIDGWHPALIIQNDVGNQVSAVTIVAAISSKMGGAHLPINVLIEPQDSGLRRRSLVQCGQVYTTDKSRLGARLGQLSSHRMGDVDNALAISLGLVPPARSRRSTR